MNSSSVRIHHVIARLNIGGPAIHVSLLASRLGRRFDPVILTGEVGAAEGDMTYYAREQGVEPFVLSGLGRELRPLVDLFLLAKLWRIFRRERPHVVHTHTAKAGTLGRLAAWLAGVPVIIHTFHGHVLTGYFGRTKSRIFCLIEKALSRITDHIVTLGTLQREEILALGIGDPEQVSAIPLGMDLASLLAKKRFPGVLHKRLGVDPSIPLVGIVARLVPIKGHRDFLEAARLVLMKRKDVRFVLVGDGELRGELEAKVREMSIREYVHFLGWERDLDRIYPDLSCLVLSSLNEGLPTAVIEAQACGVPVVSTRVGSVPELIEEGKTGHLTPVGDTLALATAIERVVFEPASSHFGESGRASCSRFSIDRLVADVEELYLRLLARKGVPL